jgi:hypothetical protein
MLGQDLLGCQYRFWLLFVEIFLSGVFSRRLALVSSISSPRTAMIERETCEKEKCVSMGSSCSTQQFHVAARQVEITIASAQP